MRLLIFGSKKFADTVSELAVDCGHEVAEPGAHSFVGAGAAVVDHCSVPPASRIKKLGSYTGKTA